MNRETIEKAAYDYTLNDTGGEKDFYELNAREDIAREAFINGAQWRINTVWHDFEEELPDKGRPVLVEAKHGNAKFFLLMTLQGDEEKEDVARYRRWAYIEDLIPDITEEER